MELKKSELTPTLKVKAERPTDIAFTKPFQAVIRNCKSIMTAYGEKVLVNLEREDKKLLFSVFLNAKSKNMLIDAFGNITENWSGKYVELKKERDEKFKKEMIVLYPVK